MTEKNYVINSEFGPCKPIGWCGYRFFVIVGVIISVVIYTIGAIVTGVVFRSWSRQANCTFIEIDHDKHEVKQQELFDYNTPMVVVGPCFMAAGGAIIIFMITQWYFCRPTIRQ